MLTAYVEAEGRWPSDDAWRNLTLPEAKAAFDARMKLKGAKITEGAPISDEEFTPGEVLQDLNLLEQAGGRYTDAGFALPEPLLRRVAVKE